MVEPPSSNLRVITTNCFDVRIIRKFTVRLRLGMGCQIWECHYRSDCSIVLC